MVVGLGVYGQAGLVQVLVTSVQDEFPKTRRYRFAVVRGVCLLLFLAGLVFVSRMGLRAAETLDTAMYAAVPALTVAYLVVLTAGYGARRLLADIRLMLGVGPGIGARFFDSRAKWFPIPLLMYSRLINPFPFQDPCRDVDVPDARTPRCTRLT